MSFDVEEVRRLSRAARVPVPPEEEAALARDLDRILEAFGALPTADAAELEGAPGAPRADVAAPAPAEVRDAILAAAPRKRDGAVKVPRRTGA